MAEPSDDAAQFLLIDAALYVVGDDIRDKNPGEMCAHGRMKSGVESVKAAGVCFEDLAAFALAES